MGRIGALLALARSAIVAAALRGAAPNGRAVRSRPLDFAPFGAALDAMDGGRRDELADLVGSASLAELGVMLAAGRLTSVELTLHYLGRVRRFDDELGAIIELNPQALAEAEAADQRRAGARQLGALDGIPVALKDNIETIAPLHTTAGAAALANNVAEADATIVSALRAAGVVVLGKTNLSELAGASCKVPGVSALGGATRNPYGTAFSPGGSSSGSAVAVAAGLCAASVGTETSGSLIAPAAFNGVVALKPSFGLVGDAGIIPLVRFQDCAGPMATSVPGVALLLAAMTGTAVAELPKFALDGVPVGVLAADILGQPRDLEDPRDNAALLHRITDGLSASGANTVEAELVVRPELAGYEGHFFKVVLGGLANDTLGYVGAHSQLKTMAELMAFNLAEPKTRMPCGQFYLAAANLLQISAESYEVAALAHREATQTVLADTFAAAGAQVLVSLTNLHSALYAGAGYPAITVPLGLRANGMPTGATFIGRPGRDAQLLAFAAAFERATRLRVPPVLAD